MEESEELLSQIQPPRNGETQQDDISDAGSDHFISPEMEQQLIQQGVASNDDDDCVHYGDVDDEMPNRLQNRLLCRLAISHL